MSSCSQLTGATPRISGRRGSVVDLNVEFIHNGVPTDPFAIYKVEIYRTQILAHNLVATIPVVDPTDSLYPAPLCREYIDTDPGECCTDPISPTIAKPGEFHLPYLIPNDAVVPDVYFDLWYYFSVDPTSGGTSPTEGLLDVNQDQLLKCCHRFWAYPESWFCDDRLQTLRFGFEPLDQKFYSPEKRPLEIGIIPLPLYDFNYNLVAPLIPYLSPTISIETQHRELIVDNAPCTIGIRQGSYRSHPYVIKYIVDTTRFLKGTYQYYVTLNLPDGSTRVSQKYIIVIA